MVNGQKVSVDKAIKKAAQILKESKHPLLYGWSNSTLEAQSVGIDPQAYLQQMQSGFPEWGGMGPVGYRSY